MNRYMTHTCDALREEHVGQTVRLSGWIHKKRDHGGLMFINLRDSYGITQVVVDPELEGYEELRKLYVESVIQVDGIVRPRPSGAANPDLPTGAIDVEATGYEVLSVSDVIPFPLDEEGSVSESLRLKYRFLDLRRPEMQRNIHLRGQIIDSMRRRMHEMGFLEIQTPILTKSSPEGARDYLVPSRLHPGKFYALPQAPQQLKQLLMASGFPRYFQIAPCFRDEDARGDRSPGEFYQLDLEMAFVEQDDVFAVVERLMHGLFTEFSDRTVTETPFPRIPFRESMAKYGSDKPDLRIPLELSDVTEVFRESSFRVFRSIVEKGGVVKALGVKGVADRPRSFFDGMDKFVKEHGAAGLAWVAFPADGPPKGSIAKSLEEGALRALAELAGGPGSACFLLAGDEPLTTTIAGRVRSRVGQEAGLIEEDAFRFCWIVDYPMFEKDADTGKIEFSHNPFSMPQGGLEALESQPPLDVLAHQYDLVCNGVELSSGAIRNHRVDIMYKAFEIAGYDAANVEREFVGMMTAFRHGAPPHGGIAPGVDRIVMLLADEPNIREVIAFPMTAQAEHLFMNAPSEVSREQLEELHIKLDLKQP